MIRVLIVDDDTIRRSRIEQHARNITNDADLDVVHITRFPLPQEPFDLVYLDHDLGVQDTYDELRSLAHESDGLQVFKAATIIVHSMNTVGAINIMRLLEPIAVRVLRVPFSSMGS